MGEAWLEGSAGVMRLDGYGRLWFAAHGGLEEEVTFPCNREGFGPSFGGDCVYNLQKHVIDHYLHGAPVENLGPDYINCCTGRRCDLPLFCRRTTYRAVSTWAALEFRMVRSLLHVAH